MKNNHSKATVIKSELSANIHKVRNKELSNKQLEEATGGILLQVVAVKAADLLGANSKQKEVVKTVSGVVDFFVPL